MKITIANTSIRTDADGRYCLNDLHKAAGGEKAHQPSNFLRLDSTQALIEEIDRSSEVRNALSVIQGGARQGTYACKELVYSFAMWISPAFHLQVIRAYDDMVQGKAPASLASATRDFKALFGVARLIGLDKNAAAISANQAIAKLTGTNVMQLLGAPHLESEQQVIFHTPTDLGKRIGVSGRGMNMLLAEAGLQAKHGEHWTPLPAAEGFCRIMDTGKRHGDGTMVQQVKWADAVLELVQRAA